MEASSKANVGDPLRLLALMVGELLLTLGVVALLFIAWQLGWTTLVSAQSQRAAVESFAESFPGPFVADGVGLADYGDPAITPAPTEDGAVFGVVYIPRFGVDYEPRPVVQGTGQQQLDTLGLGHYASTAMPGEMGNFALAGHRQTHGATLDAIHTLSPGDKIYVQTAAGYFTYVYRNNAIVLPTQSDVIAPVPTEPHAQANERYLTLTSCNPRFGQSERFIAFAVMDSWQPISAGPPQEITEQVQEAMGTSK
ncbi:Sortase family protein [Arthrobacter ulcerisalmonis]|uniref:Sortase family protein n=1 Tax=Arthrobacter ulcerisalmonis TaxID=2483813 RepID=A0A3P5WHW0_9MICC|nr:class E sortase [Arthrobacter ulcerisalmonis]VDC20362.1 Sortase family protein [Arthrobacter ulcerisalmonis]